MSGAVAQAQTSPVAAVSAAPVREMFDANGVDLFRGKHVLRRPVLTIGDDHGLEYALIYRGSERSDSVYGRLEVTSSEATVFYDGRSDRFTKSGTAWVSTEGRGQRLTFASGIYTYVTRDGTIVLFDPVNQRVSSQSPGVPVASFSPYGEGIPIARIVHPDGADLTFGYEAAEYCEGGVDTAVTDPESDSATAGSGQPGTADPALIPPGQCLQIAKSVRLVSVTNGYGYRLTFEHEEPEDFSIGHYYEWSRIKTVRAINLAGCGGGSCAWPSFEADPSADPFDDNVGNVAAGGVRRAGGRVTGMRRFQDTQDAIRIEYDTSGRVSTVYDDLAVDNDQPTNPRARYTYADAAGIRTVTVTDPFNKVTTYRFDIASERLLSVQVPGIANRTEYEYDTLGRVVRVIGPAGDRIETTYDDPAGGRGNVVQTVHRSADQALSLTTSATFSADCPNPATCNQPLTTTDADGRITDYTYHASGAVATVTAPAPETGGVRPQVRYHYESRTPTIAGLTFAPVTVLRSVSECRTGGSCVDGPAETRIRYNYDSANIRLLTVDVGPGDAYAAGDSARLRSMNYGYNAIGDLVSIDGPLAPVNDVTMLRYDAYRRRIGVVSPDPDGTGALKRRAQRVTYGPGSLALAVETGTVTDITDAAWQAFAPLLRVDTTYRAGLPEQVAASVGGNVYARSATQYDLAGRVRCAAQRMNPSAWTTTAPGCTLQTAGTFGPDRVTRYLYHDSGPVDTVTSAFGTGDQARDVLREYDPANGRLVSERDALNNRTGYGYDGLGRLVRTSYPGAAANTVSTSDYTERTYQGTQVTQLRLRDGNTIGYGHDGLGRVKRIDRPQINPGVAEDLVSEFTFDNQGRVLTARTGTGGVWSHALVRSYDAFGQLASETDDAVGGLAWRYDAAGRMARQTWLVRSAPGQPTTEEFHADYSYLATGEMWWITGGMTGSAEVIAIAGYGYDDLGRRTAISRDTGATGQARTNYAYGTTHPLLASLQHNLSGAANDVTTTFAYNPAGQIVERARDNDVYAWTGHVAVNRGYTIARPNLVTQAGGVSIGHDGRRNVSSSGTDTYLYTAENMLARVGPGTTDYRYDALGRLRGDGGRTFGYAGAEIASEYDGQHRLQARHVRGAGADEVVATFSGGPNASLVKTWLLADERGSIVAHASAGGQAVQINRYDEYGIPASGNAGLFQYTGQVWLASAGLYHYKARMYSPTLGRFLQPDPIGYADGMNLYAYVGNDPVNATDPTGTSLLSKWMWDCVGNCSGGYANTGMMTFASARDMVSNAYPGMSSASITQVARCMVSFCNSGQLESKVSWLSSSLLVEQDGGGSGIAFQAGADAPQGSDGQEIVVTAYWRKQQAAGNPIARLGLQFCYGCAADWSTAFARQSLIRAIAHQPVNGRYPSAAQVRATYGQIRVALMNADQIARWADKSGVRGLLSAGQIYDYHVSVYAKFGLPSSAFGGSYLTGSRSEAIATSWYWCARCDR